MKRPRLKKWAKWTCTLAAGAAVALAVGSGFYPVTYLTRPDSRGVAWLAVADDGLMEFVRVEAGSTFSLAPGTGWHMVQMRSWHLGYAGEEGGYGPLPGWHAGVLYKRGPMKLDVGISLLYPVALTLLPTALLWYADRRCLRPGSCGGCGYDRAGLTPTAPCPECGGVPTGA